MDPDRLARARRALADSGLDALLLGPGADLRYLTGYHALALERLTLLVVPTIGDPWMLVPELEVARARASGADRVVEIVSWEETDDPVALAVARLSGVSSVAVGDRLWSVFTLALQDALAAVSWQPASSVMRRLRLIKSIDEIDALRAAAAAIDEVHAAVGSMLRVGRTEREVGRELAELIADTHDEVNFVIVASGPNSASPHHDTGERRLSVGDPVVVDIGGTLDGYCSDATRNYVLGEPITAFREIHAVLETAQRAALDAVRPEATAGAVDEAARAVIRDAGLADAFIHRTGHGIGVEEHEEPWIVAGNLQVLEPGMAFSVEPGIYLDGRFGARIEDIVAVTGDGVEILNRRPRTLTVCDT
jgi:Xaa-Pro aminopeptidase